LVNETLDVLATITTTAPKAERRDRITDLLAHLEESFQLRDPHLPLRWIVLERKSEAPLDLCNMVFAASHVLVRRAAEENSFRERVLHFRRVVAQVEYGLAHHIAEPAAAPARKMA
jgi:hypothetical protein